MKKIILAFFMLISFPCFAVQKYFYDPVNEKMINDLSASKTVQQIKSEFNLSEVQEITIDEKSEAVRVKDGVLIKYNYIEENAKIRKEKQAKIKKEENDIKEMLNISDEGFEKLKKVLRN